MQVLLVAHEALVLAHPDDDVEIAVGTAALARMAAAAEPDPLAVGYAGGRVDVQRARFGGLALSRTDGAGLLGHAAVAAADVADRGAHELAEARARDRLQLAGPMAARARDDRRPGLGAVAVAALAAHVGLELDLDRLAARGLRQVDPDRDDDVRALHLAGTLSAAGAERVVEAAGAEERREQIRPGMTSSRP